MEQELRGFARRSIFTTRPVKKGELFTRDNVDVLRQGKLGTGLSPAELERVLSSVAERDLPGEVPLQEADLGKR